MAMKLPFSRRVAPKPARFRYDLPEQVRRRIFITLEQRSRQALNPFSMDTVLQEAGDLAYAAYGGLYRLPYDAAQASDHPVVNHFLMCDNLMALDFIEFVFQCFHYEGGDEWRQTVNEIFTQEAVGYELTPFVETIVKGKPVPPGVPRSRAGSLYGDRIEIQYPQIIKKDDEYTHSEIIRPCLELLSGEPKFKTASEEMLKAHQEYRAGKYDDAITDCGSAFETVMKTICEAKGWPYDKGKATCKDLVDVCRDKGLFPGFYAPFFIDAGTIRNKLGDAHGKGPTPQFTATKEHFEHLVQITSANILFLARMAAI